MDKTPLGLTRLDPGESLSIDGFSFQALNPLVIDTLLRVGAFSHSHDGHPKLGNPVDEPEIVADATTGLIPADTTVGVCYSVVDEYGGESLPSPQTSVTTPEGIPPPYDFPEYEIVHDQGNLRHATYYYCLTLTDDSGGETEASPAVPIEIVAGPAQNAIVFTGFDEIVAGAEGATGWRLYKSTGNTRFHYLADGPLGVDQVTDDGLLCADCLVQPPSEGKTNATNRVIVTIPVNGEIEAATAVRIYLGVGGDFTSPSLAAELAPADVVDPIYFDTLNLDTGQPPDASTTVQGANPINPDTDIMDWPWKAPVATTDDLPDGEPGDARFVMDTATIWLLGADETWTQMSAPPQYWKQPVPTEALLPTTGNETGDVRVVLEDRSLWIWNEALPGTWEKLSPKFNTVQDQGADLPQRLNYNFTGSGVTVTDDEDNNATVINVSGGGSGGGGGGGPFAVESHEGIDWTVADENSVRLITQIIGLSTPRSMALGDATRWGMVPASSWAIVGGKLKPQAAGNGQNPAKAQRTNDFNQPTAIGDGGHRIVMEYTILSNAWDYIGIRLYEGNLTSGLLEVRIVRATGNLELYWKGAQVALAVAGGDPDYTAPGIGDTRRLELYVESDGFGEEWYTSAVDADPATNTAIGYVGSPLADWNENGPINQVIGKWSDPGAFEVTTHKSDYYSYKRFLSVRLDLDPDSGGAYGSGDIQIVGDDGILGYNAGGFYLDPYGDWTISEEVFADASGLSVVIAGKLTLGGSTPPASGDIIALTSGVVPPKDMWLPVVTGDDDGRELGFILWEQVTGHLIWQEGRSSDPVTKNPYVMLDGMSVPRIRTGQ